MRVTGIVANLPVADVAAAKDFYTDYLGLSVEGFNLGWVAQFRSPDGGASRGVLGGPRRGYEIVHPLTQETWSVRRFCVRAPDGNVINMVDHSDE
jgi:hypothetical protein